MNNVFYGISAEILQGNPMVRIATDKHLPITI